jgi:Plavaka transposase
MLTTKIAKPCDERGEYLLPHTRPPAPSIPHEAATNPWNPFKSRIEFDFAHYHFVEVQNSAPLIDKALDLWAATVTVFGGDVPWRNSRELYATLDSIQLGDSPWKIYKIRYQGPRPPGTPPKWMTQTYELCARDTRQVLHHQFKTTQFKDSINLTPYRQFDGNGERTWSNLMSADWAWTQAVCRRNTLKLSFD